MACPHVTTRVYENRKRTGKGWQIRRRRVCVRCGAKFVTIEMIAVKVTGSRYVAPDR